MVFSLRRPAMRLIILLISVCGSALAQTSQAKDPIDEILSRFARPNMPGCAVSVVLNGSVVVSRAFGLADVENHSENTADTRFDLGSMSKQFVAMAVLKAASEGKLSLTEDVHRYVPELPSYKWKITLLDLLHHTSGLKDYEELLKLAGWRYSDVISVHDIL
jgi:CubicO group peptidase (beta-lactamase class C family)